jgi:apolipoprotein N-acyltransferase
LANYQHQQIAQVLSLLSARYQIMSNNDGLSSIIDPQGKLQASLPAFQSASLEGTIVPLSGTTPWVRFGDNPALFLCMACVIFCILRKKYQKFYCCKEQEALS